MNGQSAHEVNLLPESAKRRLVALYYARFAGSVALLLALGIAAIAALLVPPYLLAQGEADAATRYLAASKGSVGLSPQSNTGMLALVTERVTILKNYLRRPAAAAVFSALSENLPKGVTLSEIRVTPGAGGKGVVSVAGVAGTRDKLIAFVNALQGVSLFQGVSVPVSDLASQTDAAFTLSFSFVLPP